MKHLSLKRPARTASVALASAAVTAALTLPGLALAHGGHGHDAVPAPPAAPTSADQIQNIDQVKTAIKAYYGDTTTNVDDPVPAGQDVTFAGDTSTQKLHQFSPDSAYAHEVEGIASDAGKFLAHQKNRHHHQGHFSGTPSILFDIDDTTLNTFSYEIYSNFVFNPTTNGFFVNAGSANVFPAVPGMVDLEKAAEAKGYQVYFLTGRPLAQQDRHAGQPEGGGLRRRPEPRVPQGHDGRHPAVAGLVRRPDDARVHVYDDPVQVAHPSAHREGPRCRHRRQLR